MGEDRTLGGVARRMRILRRAFGLTRQEMQARCGFTRQLYHNYESGVSRPSVENALRLKDEFGVTLDWIIDGDDGGLTLAVARVLREAEKKAESEMENTP